jgi:anti-anti-sigma factor
MSSPEPAIAESAGTDLRPAAEADAMFVVSAVAARPAISWVSVTGKLVGDVAAARLSNVLAHQRATGCHFVRLDLSELSMLDRAGFDVLVEAHHQFLAAGGALVMTGVAPRIARLLQLTGLDRTLFTIAQASDLPPAEADPAVVDRAVGVVMDRARCDVTEATEQLATLARATDCTLGEVAQSILDEHTKPDRPRVTYAWPVAVPADVDALPRKTRRRHEPARTRAGSHARGASE